MGVNKVQYGSQVLLDISDATVTPAQLLKGAVAYNAAGERIVGTLDMNLYVPPGMVVPYAGSTAPDGWLLCDGRTLQSDRYPELYAAIGTTYGQNKPGSFKLPDLRGRVAAGANASNALASKAGADSKKIARANLPSEKLKIADNGMWLVDTTQFGVHTGKPLTLGAGRIDAEYLYTEPLGSGTAFDVRQPTLYLNYIIKY